MWRKSNYNDYILYYYRGFFSVFRYLFFNFFNPFSLVNKFSVDKRDFNTIDLNVSYFYFKKKMDFFKRSFVFIFLDFLFLKVFSFFFCFNTNKFIDLRIRYRLKQVKWNFYSDFFLNVEKKNFIYSLSNSYLSGLRYFWQGLRFWLLGLILGLVAIYYLMYIRLLPFNKIIFEWLLIVMFLYWFLSGFVFFVKKYQYGKFTTAIQRFWKRSYILFWIIESGTFLTFFYLTLNASEEPVYMYDQMKIYKTHLFSWRWFIIKLVPVISLIILGYVFQLSLKWNIYSKQSLWLLLLTLVIVYIVWLEFYQFFHIINFFGNLVWVYDYDEFLWNLEIEFRRTRMANNYISICLIAKFWHLVFIFLCWVFFVLRVNEIRRVRYPLYAANLQNFVILYIMAWLYMYPWLKFIYRKHLDVPYFWFFYSGRRLGLRVFFNDIKLFYYSLMSNLSLNFFSSFEKFRTGLFYYWIDSSNLVGFDQYKKFIIRDYIISSINKTNQLVVDLNVIV